MEKRKIWFKGDIVDSDMAMVNVLSPTSQFGLNVFEGIRGYWNEKDQQLYIFRLSEHLQRLFISCKLIGIRCPYSVEDLTNYLLETIRVNDYREDIAIRMTLFVDGEGTWSATETVEMFIAPVRKSRANFADLKGYAACISTWERISDNCLPPRVKAGANYINGRYGHLEARRNGYDLPIFLGNTGKVSEGAGSCIFMIRGNELITPPLTSSVLESITRETIIDLASRSNIDVVVRDIDRTELYLADELFLCGSAAEITPIVSVDRIDVGSGIPGSVTRLLLKAYFDSVDNVGNMFSNWVTSVY